MTLRFSPWQRGVLFVLAALAVVSLFALTFVAGRISASPQAPVTGGPDAGFARDMQAHHTQAVEMSMMVRDQTDDDVVRTIAYDVALTQQHQIGQMHAWLEEWGLPQSTSAPRMQWMAGAHHDGSAAQGRMPGMATEGQLRDLAAATGDDAGRLYLTLMIAHHQAGAEMAQAGVDLAEVPKVRELAAKMVAGQRVEIAAMEAMLEKE